MLSIATKAQDQFFWMIGYGPCYFWLDNWSGQGVLRDMATSEVDLSVYIEDYCQEDNWDVAKLAEVLPAHIISKIILIPTNLDSITRHVWKLSTDGTFTTKSAWEEVRQKAPPQPVLAKWWGLESLLLWLFYGGRLCITGYQLTALCSLKE